MDDSCAVCAETLEWVAYGACGHREVCSTCVSRLRFICNDRYCCICKTECDIIFVTKALGDYTSTISDFSVFPSDSTEGKNGSYWYHEDTGAYFDDLDHYKMVKEMCRLSCSVCDNDQGANGGPKRKQKFRNIQQLKGHLYHQHNLIMCGLCLEGRKIFICEQNLYTKAQLNQHIKTGDSEVDGSESERGGFTGHPACEFCKKPYYGDNELYMHMSTDHFNCFLCQRQNPGQYEYYNNYDDLEASYLYSHNHFRQQHFLCEDEKCLGEKFVVFLTESEMKRHNVKTHDGKMSRSKRNSVLQIPTSFQYGRTIEHNHHHRRVPGSHATQVSVQTSSSDIPVHDHVANEIDEITNSIESLSSTDTEASSRYLEAVGQNSRNGNVPLDESSFPSLPMAPKKTLQKPKQGQNTMADHIRKKGKVSVLRSAPAWTANHGHASSSTHSGSKPANIPQSKPATSNGPFPSYASSAQAKPSMSLRHTAASTASPSWNLNVLYRESQQTGPNRVIHSASAPNLSDRGLIDASMLNFPPVSATQKNLMNNSDEHTSNNSSADNSMFNFPPISATQTKKLTTSIQSRSEVEDVQVANKILIGKIRSGLEFDENKFTAFRDISGEFRLGVIGTVEYLSYIQQFGLTHLVFDLASLCPDPQKQRELIETYNVSVNCESSQENGKKTRKKQNKGSDKGKGKCVEESKDSLPDSILSAVRKLQASNYKPPDEKVEVLTRDGYRDSKGKMKVTATVEQPVLSGSNQTSGGSSKGKLQKKTSKFHRVRLGDGSAAALLGQRHLDSDPDHRDTANSVQNSSDGLPVRGVWRNGGGQRIAALSEKNPVSG
ncbi:hypothetical protein GIB67_018407 [Kingdonia uniflora]|uniref:RING-type E3 ubiquitin transferase n=1 Tax=Kingdonia uniflora TaxID=39325 RepID=A0A7J7MJJ6_9MAGN|nr:hypothetical protein GIB67_018407 [Kingdonia uniflora]